MDNVEVRTFVGRGEDLDRALRVRRQVFVIEQGVPEEIEVDGLDPTCEHVLVLLDGEPVGAGRLREVQGGCKVERVAVLSDRRGLGLGARLMSALEAVAIRRGAEGVKLHAQVQVVEFYRRLGYQAYGEPFFEADIEHRAMRKALAPDAEPKGKPS